MAKIDLRARISGIIILFILIVLMPYAIWKGNNDEENLKFRGKKLEACITNIKGIKGNNIEFVFYINNLKVVKVKTAPSNHNLKIGYKIKIIYDSLDVENVMVVW
ncbi:MAG: hypothetical protein ACOYMA_04045 [Bacteroidia bacterium]